MFGHETSTSAMMDSMIRALIFDCFGVFFTDPVFAYMRDPQTPPEKAEALHALDEQAARGTLAKTGFIKQAAGLLARPEKEIERQFFHGFDRNQQLLDFVQQARKQYKIALLSNIGGDMMDDFFSPSDRQALFDVVILSGDVKMAKPDPEIFELALINSA
jgi:FMN phosphatase YigB (HAD superfamily)